jgi:hypothetical protein
MREFFAPTAEEFGQQILPARQPAVLRSVAADWPLVEAGREGPNRIAKLLANNATDTIANFLRADPKEEGRFHYGDDGQSFNFIRGRGNLPGLLEGLREQENADRPYAIVAQSLIADHFVRGFAKAHPMPLVPWSAEPRLWIGNAAKIATHKDSIDNVAVVAAGRRRFTLFPPEAEPDLYMGPAHPTPAGTPISMVHVTAPDFDRFPRFASALEVAQIAEISPGDAIFIPKNWFHHVEALERFNILVNYWWDSTSAAEMGGV